MTTSKAWFANMRLEDGTPIMDGAVVPLGAQVLMETWALVDPADEPLAPNVVRIVNEPGKGRWNTRNPQWHPSNQPKSTVFGKIYQYSDLMQTVDMVGDWTFQIKVGTGPGDTALGEFQTVVLTVQ